MPRLRWWNHARPPATPEEAWRRGERLARRHMKSLGLRCLGQNVRVSSGEADLVFRTADRSTLVIVEVKARVLADGDPRRPEDAITAHKRAKLTSVAAAVARRLGWEGPLRVDVVAVEWRAGSPDPVLRHYERAVTA